MSVTKNWQCDWTVPEKNDGPRLRCVATTSLPEQDGWQVAEGKDLDYCKFHLAVLAEGEYLEMMMNGTPVPPL